MFDHPTIRAIVIEDDTADVQVKQIIENNKRQDVTPLLSGPDGRNRDGLSRSSASASPPRRSE
jgi:hypothetical protein